MSLLVLLPRRWYRSRRKVAVGCVAASLIFTLWHVCAQKTHMELDLDITRRYIESKIQEAMKLEKGMGCEIPELDPFSKEVTQFHQKASPIKCYGRDWVKCYHSKCRVVDAVKDAIKDIKCIFKDIIYHNDQNYTIGPPTEVQDGMYELQESDHVKVACVGKRRDNETRGVSWSGNTLGFRPVRPLPTPRGREHTFNVIMFGFDTIARNSFIRLMPKSWQMLKDIGATVMEGYNVVGDGTAAALIPILTGKTELELPDVRRRKHNNATVDSFPLIFYKLKQDGYRTAYFEDSPHIGTFQRRFNGFRRQPTDHYLQALLIEDLPNRAGYYNRFTIKNSYFCLGDTPQFKVMINMTEQFLDLSGKRFIFTFIVDISHDDLYMVQNADVDTAAFLRGLLSRAEDTLIVVMGDHGPRYIRVRDTLQGKLEERLPLLAIRLPDRLRRARPDAQRALEANARALCTPHDLHATILDVLDMSQHWNPHKVRGADYTRGLTMLEPIPGGRSCSEAGIESHWCACVMWQNVSTEDPIFTKAAHALIEYINSLVATVGSLCRSRTLTSTSWVLRQRVNNRLLEFKRALDEDSYKGHFEGMTKIANENYQIKIVVGPGHATYEATMTYVVHKDKFMIDAKDISRTNAYAHEPDCISNTHPHLNPYCYCR